MSVTQKVYITAFDLYFNTYKVEWKILFSEQLKTLFHSRSHAMTNCNQENVIYCCPPVVHFQQKYLELFKIHIVIKLRISKDNTVLNRKLINKYEIKLVSLYYYFHIHKQGLCMFYMLVLNNPQIISNSNYGLYS